MQLPKISIVVPSFNQGQFLEETLRSVIDQAYPNLQLIVIDGGSTDDSVEIIKKYEQHLHYWVSEKDGGQAQAINKGLQLANGDLHSFLNSDDCLMPGVLHEVAKVYQAGAKQLITGNWLEGADVKTASLREVLQPLTTENLILKIGLFGQPGTFWSKTEEPVLLDESYHFCLDLALFHRLFALGYQATLIEKPVAFFRTHTQAKTANLQLLKFQEIVRFLTAQVGHYHGIAKPLKALIARNKRTVYRLTLAATAKKEPKNLLAKIWEALLYDPRVFIKGI